MPNIKSTNYCDAIRDGFEYILSTNPKSFVMGQGLWSPWYVGNSMTDLDKMFGKERIIDTPISEQATTGAAIGAALNGYSVIVVHPRMDFMILAADQIVNQAAKWRHMLGNNSSPNITIRAIINRGGAQGAQHSQALHSWLAHIPGLRVLMPATASDARDMLIAAAQSLDPVIYIDDRWCYDFEEVLAPIGDININDITPMIRRIGRDITIAACGHSVQIALEAAKDIKKSLEIECEVVDIRQINPLKPDKVIESVLKTGRFLAVDGGWANCGFSSELLAQVSEKINPKNLKAPLKRITLPAAPAPAAPNLERIYYPSSITVEKVVKSMFNKILD